ncbi:ethanolamine ammonia-lyase subunit EutC [Methylorubrum extorquens]|jgi:ethanolamine ammonia-lyase small subunit|uniref:Ethanolamine ammonia-lyase small subunit n=3 Tax=Methylorubrum extorquens TaxID=408 RepID=C5B1V4_METEA|nr:MULTISPECIES: ethanolamine ammonia-lyase subunit EutC [Methylorubrum]ACS39738.1 putative ethanolamine ammonia-lyase light chain (eutC-like) [Methylorubrum extorquens AM1]MCP1542122.1 ethanolamine ammonia-lyase small subunit [Methylorubrum extorquens]MCP1590533.1 ethanolamine ammonia-lyase small subunit [Methylorubrum extorquens]BDL39342.1 ethanolamine ammonia-lyase light chain [Methylorubrum sp. GM97]
MSTQTDTLWQRLARLTPARIGLGRAGAGLPTREVLKFGLAHAQARDAVHTPMDAAAIAGAIEALGLPTVTVTSGAEGRAIYLRRPDYGRRLSPESLKALSDSAADSAAEPVDLAIVVADGLSARAVHEGAAALLAAFKPHAEAAGWRLAPVTIATQARVALGDAAGAALRARAVVVVIGERPGLSSPDSLGLYVTFDPKPGCSDAERNCISNVRPAGLSFELAAFKLNWLLTQAFSRGLTGVNLKDESDRLLEAAAPDPAIGGF